jgi:hypothetical protein
MTAAAIPATTGTDTGTATGSSSNAAIRTGRVLSGLGILFMVFDGVIHIMKVQPVVDAFAQLGYPISTAVTLGVIELVCVALYAYRRTSILGAILLTGYLGGAIATQVRIEAPLFGNTLFPVYMGVILWGGLYLRDALVRAIIPVR